MRYSLKFFLILLLLACAAIGGYVMHREAELGAKFRVPNPIPVDDEFYDAPEFITEIRSRKQVRDHKQRPEIERQIALAERLELLRNEVERFNKNYELDIELLQQFKTELIDLAQSSVGSPDLPKAIAAARILKLCGLDKLSPEFLPRVLDVLEVGEPKDSIKLIFDVMDLFGREELSKHNRFVSFMKSQVETEKMGHVSASFLYDNGLDPQPYRERMFRKSREGRDKSWALLWLVRNHFTPETRAVFEQYVESLGTKRISSYRMRDFLKIERDDPSWIALRNRLEVASHGFMKKPDASYFKEERTESWKMLGEFGTLASADLFRNAIENTEGQDRYARAQRIVCACRGLLRLGLRQDAGELIQKLLDADREYEIPVFINPKIELLDMAEELWGRDRVVEIAKDHAAKKRCQGACQKLASLFEKTDNKEISRLIASADGYYRMKSIAQLEKIQSSLLPELWKDTEQRKGTFELYQVWEKGGIDREQFVRWVNETLKPDEPLTVASVLESPRYPSPSNHWNFDQPVMDTDYQFAMIALAHSGRGNLTREFYQTPRDELEETLVAIADGLSPEFRIQSSQLEMIGGFNEVTMVVNDRLYRFSILEGRDLIEESGSRYYDNGYPIESALEVLNAIAIRRRTTGRFYFYPGEGISEKVSLAVYLSPRIARELQEKFGIKPLAGFEYYLR
jgi:hypothetical protein